MAKQRYKAVSQFQKHAAGEEFEASLDPDLERRALARGQIKAVKSATTTRKKEGKPDG